MISLRGQDGQESTRDSCEASPHPLLTMAQFKKALYVGLFNSTLLLGGRVLGRWVGAEDSCAVMHLWKYVGWLLGVNEDWLFEGAREQVGPLFP